MNLCTMTDNATLQDDYERGHIHSADGKLKLLYLVALY